MQLIRHIYVDELLTPTLLNEPMMAEVEPGEVGIQKLQKSLVQPLLSIAGSSAAETWIMVANRAQQLGEILLTQNTTLTFDGLEDGMWGALIVRQDGTGGHTLTILPAPKQVNTGLTGTGDSADLIQWNYDGVNLYTRILKNYT